MISSKTNHLSFWRHLNKLRWLCLLVVFSSLVFLPLLHTYQSQLNAHSYDLMATGEQQLFDFTDAIVAPLLHDAQNQLDSVKGTTWSANFWGLQISDPLAIVGQSAASHKLDLTFVLTAAIPLVVTLLFGRVFCGWICPATFLYELNSMFARGLHGLGLHVSYKHYRQQLKYGVLALGIVISAITGSVAFAAIYPPAIIGRELYYGLAAGGFGGGSIFFALTLLFDLLVAKRGFCRYLCPGGALYSLLGHFRLVRIQRLVNRCDDCAKCTVACEFGLDPMHDEFGQECNNCTACIAACPIDALTVRLIASDAEPQGMGHLSIKYSSPGAQSHAAA